MGGRASRPISHVTFICLLDKMAFSRPLPRSVPRVRTKFPLKNAQEKELWRLYRLYQREAHRCADGKGYLGGCVMLGSAIECLLTLFMNVYFDEALKTGTAIRNNLAKKPLLSWTFSELINVAKDAKWLPRGLKIYRRRVPKTGKKVEVRSKWDTRKAKIGDYVKVVQDVRNLVHPARYVHDHHGKRVTQKYFGHVDEVCDVAREVLLQENLSSINRKLK